MVSLPLMAVSHYGRAVMCHMNENAICSAGSILVAYLSQFKTFCTMTSSCTDDTSSNDFISPFFHSRNRLVTLLFNNAQVNVSSLISYIGGIINFTVVAAFVIIVYFVVVVDDEGSVTGGTALNPHVTDSCRKYL